MPSNSSRNEPQHDSMELTCCSISLHFTGHGSLVLLDGAATIFSAPLLRNVRYQFNECGVPVEVAGKARIDIEGFFAATRGVLSSAAEDLHSILDAARADALVCRSQQQQQHDNNNNSGLFGRNDEESLLGPRVIVVGDQNTGKTGLCRTLANLATRSKQFGVAYVDVDVGQQGITCPGSVATAFLEAAVPVDDMFNAVMPLSFFFGDKVVTAATRSRYLDLCACTAQAVASVGFAKPHFGTGGVIINTMGWITDLGKDLLAELLSIFAVTHIIVAGSNSELETAMENAVLGRAVRVLRYPTQTQLVPRTASLLAAARTRQLVSYFAGTLRTPLLPARGVVKVQDVTFVNALTLTPMTWQEVKPCSIAAVSWADSMETVGEGNVAGYVVLLEVGKRFVSFLAPAAGELPKPYLLVSSTIFLPASKVPPLNSVQD